MQLTNKAARLISLLLFLLDPCSGFSTSLRGATRTPQESSLSFLTLAPSAHPRRCFSSLVVVHAQQQGGNIQSSSKDNNDNNDDKNNVVDLDFLKAELLRYLQKRQEMAADEAAAAEIGRVVGGTKGNKILEYVSGSPNKPVVIQAAPNALDYDQLTKYGYSHLVAPIMKAGGRLAMYELLGLETPDTSASLTPLTKSAPKLEIDREGRNDKARYSGLKLGQVLNDDLQGEVLQRATIKAQRGQDLRPKLQEELYEQPFADKRNTSPTPMTPDWTPEKLDEWGRQQGKAQAWARRAREGEFVKDPLETTDLDTQQVAFSIVTGLMIATAFGKSTPAFLVDMTGLFADEASVQSVLAALQAPSLGLIAASLGSVAVCTLQAKEKNRDPFIWAIKGLLGGPLTIRSVQQSKALLTQAEDKERKKQQA